ncbi:MAG: hypothetical protein EB127_00025 [Alphaproteobacteria bacterium]|nr:hypothetical protein [Alphaproteobacteria bacterium]
MAHYNDINKANGKKPRSSHDNSAGRGADNPYKNAARLSQPTYTGTLTGQVIDPYTLASGLSPDRLGNSLEFSPKEEGMPFDLGALDQDTSVDIASTAKGLPTRGMAIREDRTFDKTSTLLKDSSMVSGNRNTNGLGGVEASTQVLLDRVGEILDNDETLFERAEPLDHTSSTSISLKDAFQSALDASDPNTIDVNAFFSNSSLGTFLGSDPDLYKDLHITPQSAARMRSHLAAIKHGTYASVPLICKGYESCPIRSSCWFAVKRDTGAVDLTASKFPILQPCPVEASILQVKVKQYCSENFRDMNSVTPTVISLATKLAELDIYEIRVNMLLSQGDSLGEGRDLMQEAVLSNDLHGNPVKTAMKEHPAFALKERFQKMRSQLMKELLSTPEAKLNAKAKMEATKVESVSSTMTKMSAALNKINNLIRDNKDSNPFDYDDD